MTDMNTVSVINQVTAERDDARRELAKANAQIECLEKALDGLLPLVRSRRQSS